jgi:hypothetical protein
MEDQLAQFNLGQYMDNITFVTDRGSNFVKAFRTHKVLFCVAHRLNNILKRCFYQNPTKKKTTKSSDNFVHPVTTITQIEETPKKRKTISTTYLQASPEVEDNAQNVQEDDS